MTDENAPSATRPGGMSGRLVLALGVALLVQALFVSSYIGALHAPKPHQIAIGVVGDASMATAVATQFPLQLTTYASPADVQHAIDHRQIDGAFVVTPAGSQLLVVPAAGPAIANALTAAFTGAALKLHQKIAVVPVHPLNKGDTAGVVSFLLTMALIIGGYLSATMAMAFGGPATQRGRGAALGTVSVLGALIADTIAGPVIGAVPTSKFWVLWGLFILIMLAVAFATAALQTVLGPAGTLVVVVVFVIFGAPAAGGTAPSAFLPGFWRVFGQYLPAGAGTTAVRNTIYFNGNGITRSLIVLTAYLVVGALVVASIRSRHGGQSTSEAEAEAEAAAAAAAVV